MGLAIIVGVTPNPAMRNEVWGDTHKPKLMESPKG